MSNVIPFPKKKENSNVVSIRDVVPNSTTFDKFHNCHVVEVRKFPISSGELTIKIGKKMVDKGEYTTVEKYTEYSTDYGERSETFTVDHTMSMSINGLDFNHALSFFTTKNIENSGS